MCEAFLGGNIKGFLEGFFCPNRKTVHYLGRKEGAAAGSSEVPHTPGHYLKGFGQIVLQSKNKKHFFGD